LMCSAMKHTLKQMEFKSLQDEVQSGQDPWLR
jgi:hypothetical protein